MAQITKKVGAETLTVNAPTPGQIRFALRQSGLSRAQFAELLGLRNRSTLTQYIGGTNPRVKISFRFCVAFWNLVNGKAVSVNSNVFSQTPLPHGTLITGSVGVCQNPDCGRHYTRASLRRRYCTRKCQNHARARRKRIIRNDAEKIIRARTDLIK